MTTKTGSDGLLRHSIILMAATQVANICNLAFHGVMGRALSQEYSLLSTMLNIMLIINTPLDALRTATAHFVSRAMQEGDRGAVKHLLRNWGRKLLIPALVLALIGIAGSGPLSVYFHSESRLPILLTSVTIIGIVYVPFLTGVLQGMQSFAWMAYAVQGLSLMRLFLGWFLVKTLLPNALSGLTSQAAGVVFALLIGGWGIARQLRGAGEARLFPSGSASYLGQSLVMLSAFGVLMMSDMLLVRHYLPGATAEQFARAATIARSIIFLPMPIAFALFPKVVTTGAITGETRRLLFKAAAMVAALVGVGVAACLLFPQLPLLILYKERSPEAMRLVRITISAMAPISFSYLLMNFEMAQRRFNAVYGLIVCAAGYLAGVAIWHHSVEQVVGVLAVASALSCVWFLVCMPWREKTAG